MDNKQAELKNNARFSALEERMNHLEEINKNVSEVNKRKRNTDKPADAKKLDGFPATSAAGPSLVKQWNTVARDAENSSRDKKNQERAAAAAEYRRLEIVKAKQDDLKNKSADKLNEEITTKTKQVKLGDSSEFHDAADWDWEDSSEDWDGTVDRSSKMNEKRKLLKKRKHEKQVKITDKANKIIGLGPIYQKSIDHFHNIVGDYSEAKKIAAREFLQVHLKFDDTEIKELDISDSQVSVGSENVLYIALTDCRSVRDIRVRMAEVRDPDLTAVDFIPPQYYERYIALSRVAKDMRLKNNSVKTQIRFGLIDVELLTKRKGSEDRYEIVPLEEIEKTNPLPKFDHSKKWSRREDRPPRRRVSPNKERLRMDDENQSSSKSRKTTSSHLSKSLEHETGHSVTPANWKQSNTNNSPTEDTEIEIDELL